MPWRIQLTAGVLSMKSQQWPHGVVCHRYNFVDPVTGWTTNDIERIWKFMKGYFRSFQPIKPHFFNDFLYDFSFRHSLRIKGNSPNQIVDSLLNDIISWPLRTTFPLFFLFFVSSWVTFFVFFLFYFQFISSILFCVYF